jgi:UDP-N-acetylmuramate dehydrogenase
MHKELKQFGKVKIEEPLAKHITMKVGGDAKYFIVVEEIKKLKELLVFLDEQGIEYIMLGGGSNILFSDDGFDGVVISFTQKEYIIKENEMVISAGCQTVSIARESMQAKLTGFEWGVGIPGTIGGALRGNAGAMGYEMKDAVSRVEVYRNGEFLEILNEECAFGYRDSIFKHNADIILRVWFTLDSIRDDDSKKRAMEALQYRIKTQPQGYASSGCIFKNIELKEGINMKGEIPQEFLDKKIIPAGWIIDKVGLKGKQIGKAQISEKHANFIVNLGSAKTQDIIDLIELVKGKVYNEYGVELEEEIKIVK